MIRSCGNFINNRIRFCVKNVYQSNKSTSTILLKGHLYRKASHASEFINESTKPPDRKVTPLGWFLVLIPVTTFGLGCWQVKRKIWKEKLIENMQMVTKIEPIDLPDDLDVLKDMEYRAVKVRGRFLHEKELFLGPRSLIRPNSVESTGGLISQPNSSNGYWVITPFQLADRDDIILINRGWIPRQQMNSQTRKSSNITDEVELVGLVRKGEQRPQFTPEHKGNIFLYRDLAKMCNLTGAQPLFLDAAYSSTIADGPIGGQTRITLRNDHLSYLVTWFSLSVATGYMWYRKILKRKPF